MNMLGYGRRTDGRVWVDGWSRRFVYYGMGGLFIDGYGWIGGMGGRRGGWFIHGYRNENHI